MNAIALSKDQTRKFSDEYFEEGKPDISPLKQTGEGILRDVVIGVIGGGLASAILGRYSFLLGLGLTGYGHYSQNKTLSALGLGMMASGTFFALTGKEEDDKKPFTEKVTGRVLAFKSEMKRKLWLDYFEEKKGKKKNVKEEPLTGTESVSDKEAFFQKENKKAEHLKEEIVSINPQNFPELNEKEKSFLEKKVDKAINQELKSFYENRQAIATYLEKGEQKTVVKKESISSSEKKVKENIKAHSMESENKNASKVKPDPYPDYEPEPEIVF